MLLLVVCGAGAAPGLGFGGSLLLLLLPGEGALSVEVRRVLDEAVGEDGGHFVGFALCVGGDCAVGRVLMFGNLLLDFEEVLRGIASGKGRRAGWIKSSMGGDK
jgi:hypothetical protein